MVTFPIVVQVIPGGRRISFPDFPGCCFIIKPPDGELATEDEYQQAIKEAAMRWLAGTPDQPGWIQRRLHDGYQIVRPGTYDFELRASEIELETSPLPPDVATMLEFCWLYDELNVGLEETARLLDISPERYLQIACGQTQPNHHEKAKLRNLRQRSQSFSIGRQADESVVDDYTRLTAS